MKTAVCPGSFDPVTNGHIDIILRASKFIDNLIVSVSRNSAKKTLFTVDERMELLRIATEDIPNVEVDCINGLLVDYVKEKNANLIIKGLRAISDFEYESQMALINKNLAPSIETLFILSSTQYQYLSASIVRELAYYGGSIDGLVPDKLIHLVKAKAFLKK